MKLSFTKMQGCANDYIYLDCRTSGVPEQIAALSERLSRRHFSIGADGIICICAPVTAGADAMMRIFNADGSEGKMCGNGIRCVARLARERYPEATGERFAVTSGGYQRYFTGPDGTVYQHILDPKTGWPVQGDLLSVTIVADNGTMADAYSTALYVMGREAAQDFWRQNGGFDMVLITKDGQVLYTPGLAGKLTETEGSGYAYASIES